MATLLVVALPGAAATGGYECCPPEGSLPALPHGTGCDGPVVLVVIVGEDDACTGNEEECSNKMVVVVVVVGEGNYCQGSSKSCSENLLLVVITLGTAEGCSAGFASHAAGNPGG